MNKEKNNFILGVVSIVAVFSFIGFISMSVAYLNKDNKNIAKDSNSINQEEDSRPSPSVKPTPTPAPKPTPSEPAEIKITKNDHIRGNFDAPITIVEYSDFQCPFCSRFHNTMNQVMEDYPDDVRWVYKHFPLDSIHPYARKAAEASECADDQGKFWEYAEELFANQRNFKPEYFSILAKELNLDTSKFDECLSSGKYSQKVKNNFAEGQQNGVTGTPGSYINGQKLGGAVPFEQLKSMIENLK